MEYLVQQPRTLETMTVARLGDWILSQGKRISLMENTTEAEDLLNRQIKIIRHYLRQLPNIYHDKLATVLSFALNKIERSLEFKFSQKNLIGRMIETIFSENLTCLSLCSDIFHASLSKSYKLTNLIDLTFCPTSWSSDGANMEEDTIQFLKELHRLRYLNLSYCSGINDIDNILRCIAENCKLVEVLKLCYLESFNDNSIHILTQLDDLRSVDLRETGVSKIGVEGLLMSCENIETINTDANEIALALEDIASFEGNAVKQFKLISYENCLDTTLEQMQLIVNMCPLIQEMSLMKYAETQRFLMALSGMQQLRKLELHGYQFYEDQVLQLLQVRGFNLTHLYLVDVEQVNLKALMCVSQMCPNLESLTLEDCDFENQLTALGEDRFQYKNHSLKSLLFRNLKRLSLMRLGNRPSQPSDEQLFFLLSSCPNVEFITTSRVPLTDDFMLRVLERNPLLYLKELRLRHQDRPTTLVIDKVVQNCVNLPEVTIYEALTTKCGRRSSSVDSWL